MFQRELARHKENETSRLGNRSTCINYIKTQDILQFGTSKTRLLN
jgi:hypothetical protein